MKILIKRPAGGMGDMIGMMSVCQGMRLKFPDAKIDYAGPLSYKQVMDHCPSINDYICLVYGPGSHRHMHEWVDNYDRIVDMYCPAGKYEDKHRSPPDHVDKGRVRIWCEAADVPETEPVWYFTEEDREYAGMWAETLPANRLIVGIQPFSSIISKNWPERFITNLVVNLQSAGAYVIMLGYDQVKVLPADHYETHNSYSKLAVILSQMDLVITPDSGFYHFAAAVRTPCIGLFGQTSGELTAQSYWRGSHWLQGTSPPDYPACSPPCYRSDKRGYCRGCEQGCKCITTITPEQVLQKMKSIVPDKIETSKWPIPKEPEPYKPGDLRYFDHEYFVGGTKGYGNYSPDWPIHKAIALLLEDVFQPKFGDQIVDLGGAQGFHVSNLADLTGAIPWLVDGSEWAVAHCDERVDGRAYCVDMGQETLPFCLGFADLVLSIEVLEHIPEERTDHLLKELYRILKKGHYAFLTIFTDQSPVNNHDESHINVHTNDWWVKKMEEHHLKQVPDLIQKCYGHVSLFREYKDKALAQSQGWQIFVVTPQE